MTSFYNLSKADPASCALSGEKGIEDGLMLTLGIRERQLSSRGGSKIFTTKIY